MPNAIDSRVRSYLDELDRALSDLPKDRRTEIVRDIRGHIDVALSEQGDPSAADVEQVLEELGTPEEIAEAAYAEQPPRPTRMAGRDVATVVLLLVGGLAFCAGWFVGVVMLWTSTAWRTRDKVIGTLLFPGGLVAPVIILGLGVGVATSTETCTSAMGSPTASAAMHCTHSGSGIGTTIVVLVIVAVSLIGPIFSAGWLIRAARRVA